MIGIITAMNEELEAVKTQMVQVTEFKEYDFCFYHGYLNQVEVVLTTSGGGKVQAAIATTILIKQFKPKGLINVGVAGSLKSDVKIDTVVCATMVAQWDFDLTAFGYKKGFDQSRYTYIVEKRLLDILRSVLNEKDNLRFLPMVTGDQFIYQKSQIDTIKKDYPNAACVDMEAGAIAQVASNYKLPFLILRSISDATEENNNEETFDNLVKQASATAAKYCFIAVSVFNHV